MNSTEKKVLYITNVNMDGKFLPGVISKIKGQLKAITDNHFETAILYTGNKNKLVYKKNNGTVNFFEGARHVNPESGFVSKLINHLRVAWFGSIDFQNCYQHIIKEKFDTIYLRFYLPGTDLIKFLNRLKRDSPSTKVLLEYPTLNVLTEMKKRGIISRVAYYLNRNKIRKLNSAVDYIVTLTKDKTLFGKPAIHMPNGIELDGITPVPVPSFSDRLVLMGVTSDCAFYHGFDKVIKGIAEYRKQGNPVEVFFRIVSNPLSRHVDSLKNLSRELAVDEWISFELPKTREQLTEEYKKIHIGVGTLALHRIHLMDNYSLKHREYAAFGIPFIMSMGDDHFENSPFVFAVERNDEPLNIRKIADFYTSLRNDHINYPQQFRNSIEKQITWNSQMKNVFAVISES